MMSADLWVAFALATVGYAAVPGPGTVYIAAQAILREPRAALWGALGLHVGGYVIVFCAAGGLTILFSAVPIVYEGLKLLGAAYLVWLGIRMIVFRSGTQDDARQSRSGAGCPTTFRQGVLVEMFNPTTVVFYTAFLPQFVAPAGDFPVWLQFLMLGFLVNLIFSLCDLLAIVIAAKIKTGAANHSIGRRVFRWMAGSVLITLGFRLAADRS